MVWWCHTSLTLLYFTLHSLTHKTYRTRDTDTSHTLIRYSYSLISYLNSTHGTTHPHLAPRRIQLERYFRAWGQSPDSRDTSVNVPEDWQPSFIKTATDRPKRSILRIARSRCGDICSDRRAAVYFVYYIIINLYLSQKLFISLYWFRSIVISHFIIWYLYI